MKRRERKVRRKFRQLIMEILEIELKIIKNKKEND
jgi:hypothetical protein